MQLVLDKVLSNLEWPHSLGAMQDNIFLHLVLFVLQKELGRIKHCKSHLRISMSPIPCKDLSPRKESKFKYCKTASHKQLHDVFVAV